MRKDKLRALVCELFEFGADKWFDWENEFIALANAIEEEVFDDDEEEMIVGLNCCKHMVPFDDKIREAGFPQNSCDECYDEHSDSFSVVRAMEKM
jgi:hypothetical protein